MTVFKQIVFFIDYFTIIYNEGLFNYLYQKLVLFISLQKYRVYTESFTKVDYALSLSFYGFCEV